MGETARYLRDKTTGELYGWNAEMAKLPQLEEVWIDLETGEVASDLGSPVSATPVASLTGTVTSDDPDEAVRLAIEASKAGLTTGESQTTEAEGEPLPEGFTEDDQGRVFDPDGHMFLGLDDNGWNVWETDEQRDARLAEETAPALPAPVVMKRGKKG